MPANPLSIVAALLPLVSVVMDDIALIQAKEPALSGAEKRARVIAKLKSQLPMFVGAAESLTNKNLIVDEAAFAVHVGQLVDGIVGVLRVTGVWE